MEFTFPTQKNMKKLILVCLGVASCALAHSRDLDLAPPSFNVGGKQAVPINFKEVWLEIEFNTQTRKAVGKANIQFLAGDAGHPLLDLMPEPTRATLNGSPTTLSTVSDPAGITKMRMVSSSVAAQSLNTLIIEYPLSSNTVTYSTNGVRFGFFMGDVGAAEQRGFMEKYAPTNLEFDAYRMTVQLRVVPSPEAHQLFSNGRIEKLDNEWLVHFPSHFTTSSFYLHLTQQNFAVREATYSGLKADIPVTIYADSSSSAQRGLDMALAVLKENEAAYGPYAHPAALAYITPSGGGMEYCGATMTSLGALEHEFTHFWFARGVMPADGNAGWIDEAIASWRDNGYPTKTSPGQAALLGGFTAYRRMTPMAAYTQGANLMAYFDSRFKNRGGLKDILKTMFEEKQLNRITSPWLKTFLEKESGDNLDEIFRKYVYQQSAISSLDLMPPQAALPAFWQSKHPLPYSQTELEQFR